MPPMGGVTGAMRGTGGANRGAKKKKPKDTQKLFYDCFDI